jgi:hypothetical protein
MLRKIFSLQCLIYTGAALVMLTQATHYFAFPFYPLVYNGGDGEILYLVFQLLGMILVMAGGYYENKRPTPFHALPAYLTIGLICYFMFMPSVLGAIQDKWTHFSPSGYAALGIIPLCIGILAYAVTVIKNNQVNTAV